MHKEYVSYKRAYARRKFRAYIRSKKRAKRIYIPQLPYKRLEPTAKSNSESRFKSPITYIVPINFSFEKDTQTVIRFLTEVRSSVAKRHDKVFIDMNQVADIDIISIVMLLSVADYLCQRKVFVQGNFPKDAKAERIIKESGFLSLVNTINFNSKANVEPKSLIVNLGRKQFDAKEATTISLKGLRHVNREELGKQFYSLVGEMGGNSIQYAYMDEKHYIYGYSYLEEEKAVMFIFADAGYGILNTLKKTVVRRIVDTWQNKTKIEILRGAFTSKYPSKTGDSNRGLGLPFIRQLFMDQTISDLVVLTNSVILNYGHPEKSMELNHNYNGTVYIWKVFEK